MFLYLRPPHADIGERLLKYILCILSVEADHFGSPKQRSLPFLEPGRKLDLITTLHRSEG
jgi:hypothetical protein